MAAAALIVALMAVSGWLAIPLPGSAVPVTLQMFGVVLAALLLPPGWAMGSLGVYVLLGAIGVPVFANHQAGLGVLLGPTGGYLFGFVAGAGLGSLVRVWLTRGGLSALACDVAAAAIVVGVVYLLGWVQLAIVLGLPAGKAFLVGVVPFVVPDAIKAGIAIFVAAAVRRASARR
jgi:biotin transport system substrate-specific component